MDQKTGFIFCARCKQRSPAGSERCEHCGFVFDVFNTDSSTISRQSFGRHRSKSDYLPGLPLWLVLYALMLGGLGLALVGFTLDRLAKGQFTGLYGSVILAAVVITANTPMIPRRCLHGSLRKLDLQRFLSLSSLKPWMS